MAKEIPEFLLYNSLTKQKETFKPKFEGTLGMYICGVTSYDISTIAHARAYIAFDVLCRYLKYLGYEVVYARSLTHVEDKVTKLYHPLALRYFLLGTHYRSDIHYSIFQIEIASVSVLYLYQTLEQCELALLSLKEEVATNSEGCISREAQECISKLHNEFETKMSDDLHTGTILNVAILDALKCMNRYINMHKKMPSEQFSIVKSLVALEKEVKQALDVLGLLSSLSYSEVLQQLKDKALERACLTEEDVSHSIEERMLALKNNDLSRGAEIRRDLGAKGIALMDTGNETIWRPNWPLQKKQSGFSFFTHIAEGVSLVCLPFTAEQQTSVRYSRAKWDIRLEIEGDVMMGKVEKMVMVMRKEDNKDHLAKKEGYINFKLEKLINETLSTQQKELIK